eukprot:CAMPEP_0185572398 /NCGR_PEP_ID=MMETSP0434-20130131/4339_1 /TAXON_ID=626734 ORGANISM="Favella taraikaensis, Strain Fe Narragansett Bay" /NCGR_SAMPLE_ID=MMETSP0434 /ASSEMBLY_ACC=CAM_ASM_000379 /LENGTH=46 /DNA_ID= /DNA_START= /DNA_END= /DNA_ORIENTATION=
MAVGNLYHAIATLDPEDELDAKIIARVTEAPPAVARNPDESVHLTA